MAHTARQEQIPRRYDLDWLRVLVILFVFVFHVGLIFTSSWAIDDAWATENARASTVLDRLLGLSSFLRMPVLFFVAGAGTWFLFRRRTVGTYLRDRFMRLGLPIVIGMLVLVPSQEYVLRRYYEGPEKSVFGIWREFLNSAFPAVNYHWSHLWFIAYLLVFSILASPLFHYLRTPEGEALVSRALRRLDGPTTLVTFAIPLILIDWALRWKWPIGWAFVDDWARVLAFFVLFVYGYILFGSDHFWNAVDRYKGLALACGTLCLSFYVAFRLLLGPPGEHFLSPTYIVFTTVLALNGWLWLVAMLGYARKFLSFENRFLRYSRDAGYPFYLLHHPMLIAVAVLIVPWQLNPLAKFAVISVLGLGLTVIVYEFLVRRWQIMRLAFGLKTDLAVTDLPLLRRIGTSKRTGPERIVLDGQPNDPR